MKTSVNHVYAVLLVITIAALVIGQVVSDTVTENIVTMRGYIVVKGVQFLNGSSGDIQIPFTVYGGTLQLQGRLPVYASFPTEMYITHISVGGYEISVRDAPRLVYRGTTINLLYGIDLLDLNITGKVLITTAGYNGALGSMWRIKILYDGVVVAEGLGRLQTLLPRTDLLEKPYLLLVLTDDGRIIEKRELYLAQRQVVINIARTTTPTAITSVPSHSPIPDAVETTGQRATATKSQTHTYNKFLLAIGGLLILVGIIIGILTAKRQ